MYLSAPVYHLKRKARLLSRKEGIPLHQALDQIAAQEGVGNWGLLVTRSARQSLARKLFTRLQPGELVLLAARPRQGKTVMGLSLISEALAAGRHSAFFTMEYTAAEVSERFAGIGTHIMSFGALFMCDCSDDINADYIMKRLGAAPSGTIAVIDYLQLLDQKRSNPNVETQIGTLRDFARKSGIILIFISQVDRSYDPEKKAYPDISDLRLPNPLDPALFDKACFMHGQSMQFRTVG